MDGIVDIQLGRLRKLLAERQMSSSSTAAARDWLAKPATIRSTARGR